MALTPKQEAFAQALVTGISQSDAYRAAYKVGPKTKPETVNQAASRIMAGSLKAFYDNSMAFYRKIADLRI